MANPNDLLKQLGLAPEEDSTPIMLQNPAVAEANQVPSTLPAATKIQSQVPVVSNEPQTAAGLMGQFATPREANYQAPQIQIPKENPADRKAQDDILAKLANLDNDYKKNLEDAENRRFKSELWATLGNYLPGVVAGATAMNTKASVKPTDVPKIVARDATGEVNNKYKTDYEKLLSQYKTIKDGSGLSAKDQLYANIAQAQLNQGAERLNKNVENTDRNAGIRVGSAILKDQKDNELSDKQLENQTDLDNTLGEIKKVTNEASKFKDLLGPNSAAYESAKEGRFGKFVPGEINKDYVKFRADAKALQSQYQKVISGLTVSDKEREELKSYIPNVEMPYETFTASAKAFEDRVKQLASRTKGNQAKFQGKNVEGYGQSQSTGKYGDTVEKDGKTYKWNPAAGKYQPLN